MKLYRNLLLAFILFLAQLCPLRAQMLMVVVAAASSSAAPPVFITGTCEILGTNGGTTASFNATGGNFIVGALLGYDAFPPVVTDGSGNTISIAPPTRRARSNNESTQIFYEQNPASMGSGHTLSVSTTASYVSICYAVFSGMKTSGVYDTESAGSTAASGNCTPGSTTPGNASNVFFSAVTGNGASYTVTVLGTKLADVAYSGAHYGGSAAYSINASGATNPVWTPNTGSTSCSSAVFLGA